MAQRVKEPVLSLPWLGSLLRRKFGPFLAWEFPRAVVRSKKKRESFLLSLSLPSLPSLLLPFLPPKHTHTHTHTHTHMQKY